MRTAKVGCRACVNDRWNLCWLQSPYKWHIRLLWVAEPMQTWCETCGGCISHVVDCRAPSYVCDLSCDSSYKAVSVSWRHIDTDIAFFANQRFCSNVGVSAETKMIKVNCMTYIYIYKYIIWYIYIYIYISCVWRYATSCKYVSPHTYIYNFQFHTIPQTDLQLC